MDILRKFFSVLTKADKKRFGIYLVVLFLGSISAVLGIGAVIPFLYVLIDPSKLSHIPIIGALPYTEAALLCAGALVLAFWLKNAISLLLIFYQSKYLGSVVLNIQNRLFSGYLGMSYEQHLNRSTPKLIRNLTTETIQFSSGVVSPVGVVFTELFSLFFVLIALCVINTLFTAIIFSVMLLTLTIFMRVLKQKARFHGENRAQSNANISKSVLESMSGIKEVQLYHCEKKYHNAFTRSALKFRQATVFSQIFSQSPRMLIEVTGLTVLMGAVGAFILMGGSAQTLLVLLSVFGVAAAQMLPSLNRLSQAVAQIRYSTKSLEIIASELEKLKDIKERQHSNYLTALPFKQDIKLKNISYTYQDGTCALRDVSLKIPFGQRVAVVGRSGAGKSTLVDLLMGLYEPQTGSIVLDSCKLTKEDIPAFQKLFGYIPQQIILYDRSISENIAFGETEVDEGRVWECLKMAQLADFVSELKDGINAMIGEGGVRLSGGQRQRLGIARALYRRPKILVMDEATSALDNQTENEITEVLSQLKDITVITIAHRLTTIKNYDLIYVMEAGEMVGCGFYEELLKSSALFKAIAIKVGISQQNKLSAFNEAKCK